MGTTVAIHQPNYLPWLGYFHKIHVSDTFVFLDDVEYSTGTWFTRNRIKTNHGWMWLTVPVHDERDEPIREARIDRSKRWRKNHRKSIRIHYAAAEHGDELDELLDETYDREWEHLADLNVHLVRELADVLDLEAEFVRSSDLDVSGSKSERLVEVCRATGADTYFSGRGAAEYNDEDLFEERGVDLVYQDADVPEYPQCHDGFVEDLSVLDAVLNLGADRTREEIERLGRSDVRATRS